MPLRGSLAGRDPVWALGKRPGVFLKLEDDRPVDTPALYSALTQPGDVMPIGVRVTPQEAIAGLRLWLAVQEPDVGQLAAVGPATNYGLVPSLMAMPGMASTTVLVGESGLAALVAQDSVGGAPAGDVAIRTFGPDTRTLAERLAAHVRNWDTRGRPSTSALRIRAHPQGSTTGEAAITIDMPHARFPLDWDHPERL
jgi:hypothetical protein